MADQNSGGQERFPFLRRQQGASSYQDDGYDDGYDDGGYQDGGYDDGGYNDGGYGQGGYGQGGQYGGPPQGGGRPGQYSDQATMQRPNGMGQRPRGQQSDAAARAAAAVANANSRRGMGGGTAMGQRPQQGMPGRMMPPQRSPMRGGPQQGRPPMGGQGQRPPMQRPNPNMPPQQRPPQNGGMPGRPAPADAKPAGQGGPNAKGPGDAKKPPEQKKPAAAPEEEGEDEKKAKQLASSMSLPYVNLDEYQIDKTVVGTVPADLCRKNNMLPIDVIKGQLAVACADPTNFNALDDIAQAAGMSVLPMVTTETKVKQAITRYLRANDELKEISDEVVASTRGTLNTDADTEEDVEAQSPVARFVSLVINQAIDDHCSDIHIEPQEKSLLVRFRIDGVLHEFQRAPNEMKAGVISRIKVLSDMDIGEHRKPQDGRITVRHNGTNVDLRVAALPTVWGEKIVMRILSTPSGNLKVEDLNFSERNFKVFKDAYSRPYGMVLVTGPTGSGKSTTLYATLGDVAKPEINVITVEDPVEFRMPGINQVQVNKKAGLTFAAALRSILRADPDVVLIGEIRDAETATIATEAALTGHLVLSTLHTNDAPSAVSRMTEMGVEPFLISSSLCAVTAQRLARRLCKYCKEQIQATPEQVKLMDPKWKDGDELPMIYHAVGCKECSGTGYRGRVSVQQVMGVSSTLESMIAKGATTQEIQEQAEKEGMTGLRDDGWEKVKEGITTVDEIIRVTV